MVILNPITHLKEEKTSFSHSDILEYATNTS